MAWATPKTDWASGDNVGNADMNQIESNTEYLKERVDMLEETALRIDGVFDTTDSAVHSFQVSGDFAAGTVAVPASDVMTFRKVRIYVPSGYKFNLRAARVYLSETDLVLAVKVDSGTPWVATSNKYVGTFYGTSYPYGTETLVTGSGAAHDVNIYVVNSNLFSDITPTIYDSWWLEFAFEPTT